MLFVQHCSCKTVYHQKCIEKFLAGGGDFRGVEIIGRNIGYYIKAGLKLRDQNH